MTVRYATLPSAAIHNLCDPMWLPEISLHWYTYSPKYDWHSSHYDALRILMRQTYVNEFNKANGHYDKLEQQYVESGCQFRNPILITAGRPIKRRTKELPGPTRYMCEWLGGSRLMIAQGCYHNIECIINDPDDVTTHKAIRNEMELVSYFQDKPEVIKWHADRGWVDLNVKSFSHMDDEYTMSDQVKTRQAVLAVVKDTVRDWLKEND